MVLFMTSQFVEYFLKLFDEQYFFNHRKRIFLSLKIQKQHHFFPPAGTFKFYSIILKYITGMWKKKKNWLAKYYDNWGSTVLTYMYNTHWPNIK